MKSTKSLKMEYKKIHSDLLKISKKNNHSSFLNFLKSSPPKQLKVFNGELSVYLSKAIVGQQLSTKAAKTIWGRAEKFIINQPLQNRNLENDLRDSGLSQKKCEYVKNILISNKLQKKKNYYKTIGAEGFTNLLISYKGIGPWTVDMAKMFFLGDVDILPKGDLAIKRACNNFFPNETLESIEEIYKPFNSYLSLNLWDSLD